MKDNKVYNDIKARLAAYNVILKHYGYDEVDINEIFDDEQGGEPRQNEMGNI